MDIRLDVLAHVQLVIMRQPHEVHHLPHVEEPVLDRMDHRVHPFAHQSPESFVEKSGRVFW